MWDNLYRIWSNTFAVRLLALLLSFVSSWILAQVMTENDYGTYVYIISIVSLLAGVAASAFDDLSVRLVSAYQTNRQFALLQGLWRTGGVVTLAIALVVMAAWSGYLYQAHIPELIGLIGIITLNVPLLAVLSWLQALLLGSKHTLLSQLPENILKPLLLLLPLLFAFFVHQQLDIFYLFQWHLLLNSVVLLLAMAMVWYYFGRDLPAAIPEYRFGDWSKNAATFLCISTINLINIRTDILALGNWVSHNELAYYNIAAKLSELLKLGFLVSNLVFAPVFATLFAQNDLLALQQIAQKSSRLHALLGLLALLFFVFAGKYVLGFWGVNYRAAYPVLLVLAMGQWVNLSFGMAANVLQMTGHQRWIFYAIVLTTLFNVGLNVYLVPLYGGMGAAMAMSLATVLKILVWNIAVYRNLGIRVGAI